MRMKKSIINALFIPALMVIFLIGLSTQIRGQELSKSSQTLPADVNKIISNSCMPCHSAKGGLLSRSKLNFDEWAQYSAEKQKSHASKIYSEVSKKKMPPTDVRETRPDLIPTTEQVEVIKKWKDAF